MSDRLKQSPEENVAAMAALVEQIRSWATELGFQAVAISDTDLQQAETRLQQWLDKGYHGEMNWMADHGTKRTRPEQLQPGTLRIISARMAYLPESLQEAETILATPAKAYISRYALGRDYHKLMRMRLKKLAERIRQAAATLGYRVFVDSAPVMEKPLAEKAGLGWIGKHTNLIDKQNGSWFFLGEIFVDIPLPVDHPAEEHCGTCTACLDICPTRAIIAPWQLDARLCISYLTIEHRGAIPEALRPLIGNRIYGCDDCQLCCPWNRFAQVTAETDFLPRHQLDNISLLQLFNWEEDEFLKNTEGSAIRRIGYHRWLRNIAVGLGNADYDPAIIAALKQRQEHSDAMVQEHIQWALAQQSGKKV